ncbi:MAG: adenylosuccinate synthetase [Nanoarchaeota archaeon]|nr:adenylosuccinate synthetase [Nanoarchaeota archaeon]
MSDAFRAGRGIPQFPPGPIFHEEGCEYESISRNTQRLAGDSQIVAVVDQQWGDTGKGKFADMLCAYWADGGARGTGGNNAGHTVIKNGEKFIFHLVPASAAYDNEGKFSILGGGMVINPVALVSELEELVAKGGSYNHVMVSSDAQVVFPYHILRDCAKNQSQKDGGIGSTGRGIGPCYADKINRRGISMGDLLKKDVLVKKLRKLVSVYVPDRVGTEFATAWVDEQLAWVAPCVERLQPLIRDTVYELHGLIRSGKKVCLEGAQGLLLSVEHGTVPHVTSSDCSLNGTAGGVGLSAAAVDLTLGIMKFPFMTRVGGGPFPSELGGVRSADHCADALHTSDWEVVNYGSDRGMTCERVGTDPLTYDHTDPVIRELMNSEDEFLQGVGVRLAAGEYGASTGRPRRVGWCDLVAAEYAALVNGGRKNNLKLVLTRVDCLAGMDEFKLVDKYMINGSITSQFPRDAETLSRVCPLYRHYQGYGDMRGVTDSKNLPSGLRAAMDDLSERTDVAIAAVSTGPEQHEVVVL